MKPTLQTMFRDPDGTDRGNCLSAALASVMEVDVGSIPHFVQMDEDGKGNWWGLMQSWLGERNLWLAAVPGYVVRYELPPTALVLATGPSPRNAQTKHMVVFRAGAIIHDPHPDGTGLDGDPEEWGYYVLAQLDPALRV